MFCIRVPATSANMGPGFDSMGVALSLYNYVWMEPAQGVKISSADGSRIPTGEKNLIYRSAKKLFDYCGRQLDGLHIIQENGVPMTRGLGSSSACITAGLLGANEIMGRPCSTDELIDIAASLEGHPDNSTPAFLGGFVVSVLDEGKVYHVKKEIQDNIAFAAFIPNFHMKTEVSRKAVPNTFSRADAVYNLSRAALTTAMLFNGDVGDLKNAMQDCIHQPYRLPLIAGGQQVFDIAYKLGAYGVYISGAGSTIMAIINAKDKTFQQKAIQEMRQQKLNNYTIKILKADNIGACIIEKTLKR